MTRHSQHRRFTNRFTKRFTGHSLTSRAFAAFLLVLFFTPFSTTHATPEGEVADTTRITETTITEVTATEVSDRESRLRSIEDELLKQLSVGNDQAPQEAKKQKQRRSKKKLGRNLLAGRWQIGVASPLASSAAGTRTLSNSQAHRAAMSEHCEGGKKPAAKAPRGVPVGASSSFVFSQISVSFALFFCC
jgi:hypothetical protein